MNLALTTSPSLLVRALVEDDRDWLALFASRESVIPVQGANDLSRRLAPDRRIFALILPDGEVAGFVQVALTRAFPRKLEQILRGSITHGVPAFATFYGITRTSERMKGRADEMLAAVANSLLATYPHLTLSTLSPIPGLRAWLEEQLAARGLANVSASIEASARRFAVGLDEAAFARVMATVTYHYLHSEGDRGCLIDPVARFHLGNGAFCRRTLIGADCSWHGLEQSFGTMTSYQYHPGEGAQDRERRQNTLAATDLDVLLQTLAGLSLSHTTGEAR